ncbi:DUF3465 domain-containing protein [Protaetiibacter larvae]|uniref:DUF3465 domain-containing protein n=1 Tax=Protaetiibacter larvae TaxID=2592654 RepID=A0A5C1Y537_9MICO|nr:DUF3465 domain-containing protein [Protaetiibacter larvae]QEO09004.1 DUF3465 domain-containing protein [Protaetiibacter larvae]
MKPRRILIGLVAAIVVAVGAFALVPALAPAPDRAPAATAADDDGALQHAHDSQESNVQVHGTGTVERVLTDDVEGDRHQRFILRLPIGFTVLVAHNIDVAPRLDGIAVGDTVEFFGEYEWSEEGGTVHWTHRDPAGVHEDGWLKWDGSVFD